MRFGIARRRAFGLALATVCACSTMLWQTPAQAAPFVSPVITGKGATILPAATDTYLGWSANSKHHKNHFDVYAKKFGKGRKRLNSTKVNAWSGGISGDTFAVQVSRGPLSDIGLVDLKSHKVKKTPSGINTKLWEWSPTIDSSDILFGRIDYRKKHGLSKVLLYHRSSHHTTMLDKAPAKCRCLFPGQVRGNYATWTKCASSSKCNSFYYDIAGRQKHPLPTTAGKIQYYAAPDGTGTFYYARSGSKCSSTHQILRWAIGDPSPTLVTTLPSGFAFDNRLYETTGGGGQEQVYFDRTSCKRFNPDIFMIDDAETRTAPSFTASGRSPHAAGGGSALPVAGAQAGP